MKEKGFPQLPPDARLSQVLLVDSLGTVQVAVPVRYDTFFTWINWSDCGKPCARQEYRFQNKLNRITEESGFLWTGEPNDSIDRFTISHSSYIPFHEGDTGKNVFLHNHIKAYVARELQYPSIIFDTIEKIDGRYFSVMVMERSDTIQEKRVLAVSTIKRNEIWFEYTLKTKVKDSVSSNFVRNSLELIKWIRISKGV